MCYKIVKMVNLSETRNLTFFQLFQAMKMLQMRDEAVAAAAAAANGPAKVNFIYLLVISNGMKLGVKLLNTAYDSHA